MDFIRGEISDKCLKREVIPIESFKVNLGGRKIVGVLKQYMRDEFHKFNEPSDKKKNVV